MASRKRPDQSARLKALWQDPEYRAKHTARLQNTYGSRAGVPNGHTKKTVAPLWAEAHRLADRFIAILKERGEFSD